MFILNMKRSILENDILLIFAANDIIENRNKKKLRRIKFFPFKK